MGPKKEINGTEYFKIFGHDRGGPGRGALGSQEKRGERAGKRAERSSGGQAGGQASLSTVGINQRMGNIFPRPSQLFLATC